MYSLVLHGRRLVDLQKWRHHLRVSVKLVQNASPFSNPFSSATAADVSPRDGRKGQVFTFSYLVDSLGLTAKLAESISRKVSFVNKGNPDAVLYLLRSYGFTDSQISNIITDYPRLLMLDAKKSLGPKLQFLQSRGASTSEFTEIVTKVPEILGKKGDKSISVYYDFVKNALHDDKSSKWETSCQSLPESTQENKMRNVSVLRKLGVPKRLLLPLLNSHVGPIYGKENFEESLKKVNKIGFNPTTSRFIQALGILYEMSDKTIEERVNVYKKLGFMTVREIWAIFKTCPTFLTHSEKKILNSIETFLELGFSRGEYVMMIKRQPECIAYSAESVKKKTEFWVKKMNWPLKALVLNPEVLGYSMEKRIAPRCNVIKALFSRGLLGDKGNVLPPMPSVLACSDEKFLKSYVKKHDDKQLVLELMAIFSGDDAS